MRGREDKRKGFAFQLMCQKCQGREEKKAPLVYWLHAWARGVCNDCHGPAPSFSDKHASGDLLRGCSVSDGGGGALIMSGYLLSVSAFLSISGVHVIVIVKL